MALEKIAKMVDQQWIEVAEDANLIMEFLSDPSFDRKEAARQVLAKIYFHLEDQEESLIHALKCGQWFNVEDKRDPWVTTMLSLCIDKFIANQRGEAASESWQARTVEEQDNDMQKVEKIVSNMVEHCLVSGDYSQVIGMAVDCRRMDWLNQCLSKFEDPSVLTSRTVKHAVSWVDDKKFRGTVLSTVEAHQAKMVGNDKVLQVSEKNVHHLVAMVQCYILLADGVSLGNVMNILAKGNPYQQLLSFQIAFDLEETHDQKLTNDVVSNLIADPEYRDGGQLNRIVKLKDILAGLYTTNTHLNFLMKNNNSEHQVLNDIRKALDPKFSVSQTATFFCNGLANASTGDDSFIRENLEWCGKSTQWASFSQILSLGMIHSGNHSGAMDILSPQMPQQAQPNPQKAHMYGGALASLGLVFANHQHSDTLQQLLQALQRASEPADEVQQHGACLGIGLMGMGSCDVTCMEQLKNVMYTDNAVAAEGAAFGIGLLFLGHFDAEVQTELLKQAKDTKHEKIIRAIAVAIALMQVGAENQADQIIEMLSKEQDQWLRQGAALTIGCAQAASGNAGAVKKLLHMCVSDTNQEVRRVAAAMLGLLLAKKHDHLLEVIKLLTESYNAYVRWGAAIALGMACCSSGSMRAQEVLKLLKKDSNGWVRQAQWIGSAMVMCNIPVGHKTEAVGKELKDFRESLEKACLNKHEESLSRFGALVGQGLIDAGGRNMQIKFLSEGGAGINPTAVAGIVMFLQSWFWFPCTAFLHLALRPTVLVALNEELNIPLGFSWNCKCKKSLFDQPPKRIDAKKQVKKSAAKVELTVNNRARLKKKDTLANVKETDTMEDVNEKDKDKEADNKVDKDMNDDNTKEVKEDQKEGEGDKATEKKEDEPNFQAMTNPSRVLRQQEKYIEWNMGERQLPVIKEKRSGIVMVVDTQGDQPYKYIGDHSLEGGKDAREVAAPLNHEMDVTPPKPFYLD